MSHVPLPRAGLPTGATCPPLFIAMVHVPVSNILMMRDATLRDAGLPCPTREDYRVWRVVAQRVAALRAGTDAPEYGEECSGLWLRPRSAAGVEELVGRLSFARFLVDRALGEIAECRKLGFEAFQVENVGAPYSSPPHVPVLEEAVLHFVCTSIRAEFPELPLGVQVLSAGELTALEIALRHRCFYLRGESLLFPGIRPDCTSAHRGQLKKLYLLRGFFNRTLGLSNDTPRIWADVLKKHTFFPPELSDPAAWREAVRFMKTEGVILTGPATGTEVDVAHAEDFGQSLRAECPDVPLVAGSGAAPENIQVYERLFNAIIVGSSIKHEGRWENTVDGARVRALMDARHSG